jgi:hypothetical protein
MTTRTKAMSKLETTTRARQARAFLAAAALHADDPDAANATVSASLSVLAGIAASDAMCGHALKKCAQGDDHAEATALLATVNAAAARRLRTLISAKSTSSYGASFITNARAQDLLLQAQRLCGDMDELLGR